MNIIHGMLIAYVLINCEPGFEYQVVVEGLKSSDEVVDDNDDAFKVYRYYDIIAKVSQLT
jgi:hypothetical protein